MAAMRGLYLIRSGAASVSARADDDDDDNDDAPQDGRLATLEVDFSQFDRWYRIESFFEGRFLERVAKGSFKRTIEAAKRDDGTFSTKVLFNHGFDMYVHDKMLTVPEVLEEREDSPHLEGGLFDTTYNRDLLPGLRAGAYGSSFMFEVVGETWNREPEESEDNPDALPERTITEVKLHEAGPVTWPANPEATAGIRSGTDWLVEQLQSRDLADYDEMVRSFTAFRALHGLGIPSGPANPSSAPPEAPALGSNEPARHVDGAAKAARERRLTLLDMAR